MLQSSQAAGAESWETGGAVDTFYIASLEEKSGKTLLAASLGQKLVSQGKRVGYLKPVGAPDDPDPETVRQALGLPEGAVLAPPVGLESAASPALSKETRQRLLSSLQQARTNADVLLIEAPPGPFSATGLARDLAELPDARLLLIVWYSERLDPRGIAQMVIDQNVDLAGVILNGIPPLRTHHVRTKVAPAFSQAGLPVIGLLPQDRTLRASTIREIAEAVGGEIHLFPEKADTLVENVMIGALTLDSGAYYFGQKTNKLVITRWDRPDMQNAALETDMVGFLLTGGEGPIPYMRDRVQGKELPVVIVQEGTIALATRLDQAFSRGALHPRKIGRAAELLAESVDLDSFLQAASSQT